MITSGEHPGEPGQCRDGVVFKAEVLSDEESAAVEHRFAATRAVAKRDSGLLVRRSGLLLRRSVGEAWRSERVMRLRSVLAYRTRQAPRDLARLVWFVFRGHSRWAGKAWTSFTYGDLRADARAARMAGDPEARRRAQELMRADSRARWARVGIVIDRAGTAAWALGAVGGALWLADSVMTRDEMWSWLAAVYSILAAVGVVIATVAQVMAALAVVGWVVAAAFEGRDRTPGAGWLVRPNRDDADSWVDERMISQALAHLGIAPMDRFFKTGGELVYTVPARVDGNGTYAQVRLPMGVTAGMVADRRDRLAANLGRAKLETWPTEGGLHPIVVAFDECHEMFEHREFGAEAAALAVRVVKNNYPCGLPRSRLVKVPSGSASGAHSHRRTYVRIHWSSV